MRRYVEPVIAILLLVALLAVPIGNRVKKVIEARKQQKELLVLERSLVEVRDSLMKAEASMEKADAPEEAEEPMPLDPFQEEIDRLTKEIAELEDSYPPASALWSENVIEKEVVLTPPAYKRLDNGFIVIPLDSIRETSVIRRFDRSTHEMAIGQIKTQITLKKLRITELMLQRAIDNERTLFQKLRDLKPIRPNVDMI